MAIAGVCVVDGLHYLNPLVRIFNFFPGLLYWLLFLAIALFLRFIIFPEFYELQEVGLFLRQGRKKNLISYASIDKILPLAPAVSNWYPADRFFILLEKGNAVFTIAMSGKERFLVEVSKRCPQLEQRETKYGLSLQRAIL